MRITVAVTAGAISEDPAGTRPRQAFHPHRLRPPVAASGKLTGPVKGTVTWTPYNDIIGKQKALDPKLFELARVLAE